MRFEKRMWQGYSEPKKKQRDRFPNDVESDKEMAEYIERKRMEFHKDWFEYLEYAYK